MTGLIQIQVVPANPQQGVDAHIIGLDNSGHCWLGVFGVPKSANEWTINWELIAEN